LLPDDVVNDRGKQVAVYLAVDMPDFLNRFAEPLIFVFQVFSFFVAVLKIHRMRFFPVFNQPLFFLPRQPLARIFASLRLPFVLVFFVVNQFDRQARPGVFAANPIVVSLNAAGKVVRPSGIERFVSATQDIGITENIAHDILIF
jgi:hypothetical protein